MSNCCENLLKPLLLRDCFLPTVNLLFRINVDAKINSVDRKQSHNLIEEPWAGFHSNYSGLSNFFLNAAIEKQDKVLFRFYKFPKVVR